MSGRVTRTYAFPLVLAGVLGAFSPAFADTPAPSTKTVTSSPDTPADVEAAEQLYAKLDYEGANGAAERAVRKSALRHDHLVRTYRVLATTYAILGKEELARDAFLQLLTYDPEYQVDPNLGPKVNTPFMEARGSFRSLSTKPGIDVVANVSTSGGTLRVATHDPTRMVKRVEIGYRWTSAGDYRISTVNPSDTVVIEVASAPIGRSRLDFYVQAFDERANAVLEFGSAAVPRSAFAEVGPGGASGKAASVLSSPILWLVTGAVVLGGTTAAYFAFRPNDPPTHASLSPVIICGRDRCN